MTSATCCARLQWATALRQPDPDLEARDQLEQTKILITLTKNTVTNRIDQPDAYRTPLGCETRTYELTGLSRPPWATPF